MQKAIRRADEDCWGLITQEIKALHDSYQLVNKGVAASQARGRIFISKAVIVLSLAKKNRDADHLQNFIYDQCKGIDAAKLAADLRKAPKYVPIPDYAYDCHTRSGERRAARRRSFSGMNSRR